MTVELQRSLRKGDHGEVVKQVQQLLNLAGSHPHLPITGRFLDMTDQAVRYFQRQKGLTVDGIVGRNTYGALQRQTRSNAHANPSPTAGAPGVKAPLGNGCCFPFAQDPVRSYKDGGRQFGAGRAKGRLHAGCDLRAPVGTSIYAVADGTLFIAETPFYSGTNYVAINHGSFIIRYGEIMPDSYIGGKTVRKGEKIAEVGRLNSGSSMLHFEMFSDASNRGHLSGTNAYKRRADLINPTRYLDEWIKNKPR